MKKLLNGALALTLCAVLSGCGSSSGDDKTLTIGASITPHAEIIKNIQKYLRENLPVVPIANTQQVVGVRSDVQGFTPTPAASHFYDKVYFGTAEGTTAE